MISGTPMLCYSYMSWYCLYLKHFWFEILLRSLYTTYKMLSLPRHVRPFIQLTQHCRLQSPFGAHISICLDTLSKREHTHVLPRAQLICLSIKLELCNVYVDIFTYVSD